GEDIGSMDRAYPRLVADVLPAALGGFFLAVLLGAVFSSFNSLLNSAATLVCIDIIGPFLKREMSDARMIRMARTASIAIALMSFAIAPLLQFAPEGLWQVVRKFTGFYNVPIIAVVCAAFLMPRATPAGVIAAVIFHLPVYAVVTFVWETGLHFVHIYAILFLVELVIIRGVSGMSPQARPAMLKRQESAPVDMTPWRWTRPICVLLILAVVAVYWLFSPWGLADS
ncbi:MAG: solute:sodium symporter family transporter, partial [Gammaproteobacteria bacterium]|nr:solute:sodium symporter family transporter [Gammaproteobacteria bacterium]